MKAKVSTAHNDAVESAIREELDNLGDLSRLLKGKHVAVKLDDTRASRNDASACMRVDMLEAAEFFDHSRPPFVPVALEHGPQKEVMVNPRVFEYDTLVSLARHRAHDSATVTLTMKNVAMSCPAADYCGHPRMHRKHPRRIFNDLLGFIAAMCRKFAISSESSLTIRVMTDVKTIRSFKSIHCSGHLEAASANAR